MKHDQSFYSWSLVSEKPEQRLVCPIIYLLLSELESKHDFVVKVRDLVRNWSRPTFIVMRYLFAFLNHLSEFRYVTQSHKKKIPLTFFL